MYQYFPESLTESPLHCSQWLPPPPHLLIHSLSKYLLQASYMPGTVLGNGSVTMSKTGGKNPCLYVLDMQVSPPTPVTLIKRLFFFGGGTCLLMTCLFQVIDPTCTKWIRFLSLSSIYIYRYTHTHTHTHTHHIHGSTGEYLQIDMLTCNFTISWIYVY